MSSNVKIEISPTLLRTLHRIHRQRADLKGQIERCPRQIKAGEVLIAKAEAEGNELREKLKRATIACDDKAAATQIA